MLKRDQEAAAAKLGYWFSDLVATDLDGRPVHPKALLKRFRAATRAAGLPEIRLHDARHTYAAYALENGVSPHIVAARLGHSSASFTLDTYAKSIPAADKGASQIVESALTAQLRDLLGREKGANLDEMNEISEPDKHSSRVTTRKNDDAN
jgi:integrase